MARRKIEIDGATWEIYPSGRVTQYARDEFTLVFEKGTGADIVRRFTKFSPLGARRPEKALAELTDRRLLEYFRQSQPAWTSPQAGYTRVTS